MAIVKGEELQSLLGLAADDKSNLERAELLIDVITADEDLYRYDSIQLGEEPNYEFDRAMASANRNLDAVTSEQESHHSIYGYDDAKAFIDKYNIGSERMLTAMDQPDLIDVNETFNTEHLGEALAHRIDVAYDLVMSKNSFEPGDVDYCPADMTIREFEVKKLGEMDIQGVVAQIDKFAENNRSGIGPYEADFVGEKDGQSVSIGLRGKCMEFSHEFFDWVTDVAVDGKPVFSQYGGNGQQYSYGNAKSAEEAKQYLLDNFGGVTFTPTPPTMQISSEGFEKNWIQGKPKSDAELKAEQDARVKANSDLLSRVVFQDQGIVKGKERVRMPGEDGKMHDETVLVDRHKVVFALACDQKQFGQDAPVANPYIVNRSYNGKVNHAVYLDQGPYDTLMRNANMDGDKKGKWTGVVNARVDYAVGELNAHDKMVPTKKAKSIDLTNSVEVNGLISKPDKPFSERAHDAFVKRSLAGRALPKNVPEVSTGVQAEDQLGE